MVIFHSYVVGRLVSMKKKVIFRVQLFIYQRVDGGWFVSMADVFELSKMQLSWFMVLQVGMVNDASTTELVGG